MRRVPLAEIEALPKQQAGQPPTFTVVKGMPGEILHHICPAPHGKPPLVQLASQFNGCESPMEGAADLMVYVGDTTQGPAISLTALIAASLRLEEFRISGYDAMRECLGGCVVMTPSGERPICDLYSELCVNGYFRPHLIGDSRHLSVLAGWLQTHKPPILLQWVECEESGAVQLQVFNAAPYFQRQGEWWKNFPPERAQPLMAICEHLLVGQYRALAQIAAHTGQDLHLTLVGMGVFHNPPQLIPAILRVVAETLDGTGVRVFLHAYGLQDAKNWSDAMRQNGLADAGISLI
jgi:hypothetical protein